MIVRKFLFFKSVQCFVKKDKTFLKFLGHFVLFVKKIWDGLSIPKGYFVLGTFCPKDRSVTGTLHPRMFRPGTFRQGTSSGLSFISMHNLSILVPCSWKMLITNINVLASCSYGSDYTTKIWLLNIQIFTDWTIYLQFNKNQASWKPGCLQTCSSLMMPLHICEDNCHANTLAKHDLLSDHGSIRSQLCSPLSKFMKSVVCQYMYVINRYCNSLL
jgi:hypothetical protein